MLATVAPEIMGWPAARKARAEAEKGLRVASMVDGHWDATIFPNCSYLVGSRVFKVWNPVGPDNCDIFTWAVVDKTMPEDLKRRVKSAVQLTFGPAGMLESDDTDNLVYIREPNRGSATRKQRLSLQMGLGREQEDPDLPGLGGNIISDTAQRGFYRFYADCLSSNNWEELDAVTATWKEDVLRK
jgi:3-phenylpropionate/trans-cinnamate dioxygenase alpha subunit